MPSSLRPEPIRRGVLEDCGTRGGLIENMPMSPVSVVVFNIFSSPFGTFDGDRFSWPAGLDPCLKDSRSLTVRGRAANVSLKPLSRVPKRAAGGMSMEAAGESTALHSVQTFDSLEIQYREIQNAASEHESIDETDRNRYEIVVNA